MPATGSGLPAWEDSAAYAGLLDAERAAFAWEWLRRQPQFINAAEKAIGRRDGATAAEEPKALEWHLHRFEDPRLDAFRARPVWAASKHKWVVNARAAAAADGDDIFELGRLQPFASLIASPRGDRLLLSDGRCSIRLDAIGASLSGSPVQLSFELCGIRGLDRPLLVLRRLRSLAISGRFIDSLYPPVRRARRHILLLRTHDALAAGASQADLAERLLSSNFERRGWRVHSSSIRLQAQRLVRVARRMANGQFWNLLD